LFLIFVSTVSRPLPGTSTNSKESIFMKLNKRISLLEQNFSISNEHLNELNKKTTKTEEFVAKQEKITKTTSENVAKHEQKVCLLLLNSDLLK